MLRADELAPTDLLRLLWRWCVPAIGAGLICGAVGYGYSLFIPDRYSAGTLVLVEDEQLPAKYVQSTSTLNLGARLSTLQDRTLSRPRLDHLMREYGLLGDPLDPVLREAGLNALRKRITVAVSGTESFRIAFSDEDPELAATVANALAGFFIDDSTQAVARQVENTSSALRTQLERIGGLLDDKEDEISRFKTANMGMLPEQLSANLSTVNRLQQQLADNNSRQARATDGKHQLEVDAAREPTAMAMLSSRDQARQLPIGLATTDFASRIASQPPRVRLEALKLQRESLLRSYTERHPDVQLLGAQIESLEREIAATPEESAQSATLSGPAGLIIAQIRTLDMELDTMRVERADLQRQMSEYQARIEGAPEVEESLRELDRDYTSLSQQYEHLMTRIGEAQLAGDLQRIGPFARFRIIDPAVAPHKPASPMRVLFLAGGLALGVCLVFGFALARETTLEPLHTAIEVERYAKLPVLASIPVIETPRSRRLRQQRFVASSLAVASVLAAVFVLRLLMRPF